MKLQSLALIAPVRVGLAEIAVEASLGHRVSDAYQRLVADGACGLAAANAALEAGVFGPDVAGFLA
jgi:hypothetical protein